MSSCLSIMSRLFSALLMVSIISVSCKEEVMDIERIHPHVFSLNNQTETNVQIVAYSSDVFFGTTISAGGKYAYKQDILRGMMLQNDRFPVLNSDSLKVLSPKYSGITLYSRAIQVPENKYYDIYFVQKSQDTTVITINEQLFNSVLQAD